VGGRDRPQLVAPRPIELYTASNRSFCSPSTFIFSRRVPVCCANFSPGFFRIALYFFLFVSAGLAIATSSLDIPDFAQPVVVEMDSCPFLSSLRRNFAALFPLGSRPRRSEATSFDSDVLFLFPGRFPFLICKNFNDRPRSVFFGYIRSIGLSLSARSTLLPPHKPVIRDAFDVSLF